MKTKLFDLTLWEYDGYWAGAGKVNCTIKTPYGKGTGYYNRETKECQVWVGSKESAYLCDNGATLECIESFDYFVNITALLKGENNAN